jgi:hypothetical protein
VAALLLFAPLAAQAQDAGMVAGLVEQLGITEAQAKGGVQALLATAKGNLSGDEFGSLLESAPDLGGLADMAGGAAAGDMMKKAETMAEGSSEMAAEASDSAEDASSEMEGAMSSVGSALSSAEGAMGGLDLSSLSKLTDLTKSFESLGLDAGMVQKFVPVVLGQLGSSSSAAGLLKKGLGLVS